MLFSQRFPSLNGGVSQAEDVLKAPHEFTEVENVMVDPLRGLRKRPGTNHTAYLGFWGANHDNGFYETVNRSDTERYTIHITNGNLRVYDTITGSEYPVAFPDGKDYLSYTSSNNWRACTVGDSTYLTNRERTVKRLLNATSDAAPSVALVNVIGVQQHTSYHITVSGPYGDFYASVHVDDSIDTGDTPKGVRQKLIFRLNNVPGFTERYYAVGLKDGWFSIESWDGHKFSVSVSTTHYNTNNFAPPNYDLIRAVVNSVRSFEELPPVAPDGMVLLVEGQPGSSKDDTWVKAERLNSGSGHYDPSVVWRETVAPETPLRLDPSTMPHVLIRNGKYREAARVSAGGSPWNPLVGSYEFGEGYIMGWEWSYSGENMDSSPYRYVSASGEGAYTDDFIPATSHETQKITVRWAVDTSQMVTGDSCSVLVTVERVNAGTYLLKETYDYPAGYTWVDAEASVVVNTSTDPGPYKVTIQLSHGASAGKEPILGLYGTASIDKPVTITPAVATRVDIGRQGQWWPMGMFFDLSVGSANLTISLPEDMTTEDLAQYLAAEFEGKGIVSTIGSYGRGGQVYLLVTEGGNAVHFGGGRGDFDATRYCFFPDADYTPDSLVGLIVTNHTTGATGTIVSNSRKTIEATLTKGTRQTYQAGDEVSIGGYTATDFIFKRVDWGPRLVGDTESSPWPSFLGKSIADIFYHRGRLGFISDNSVVMSASQDVHRFFRATTTSVLDDDPIDIEVAGRNVVSLASAVEWAGMLVVSSTDGAQYSVTGEPVLSPTTVALENISTFPQSPFVRPYRLGSSLIFCSRKAGYTNVRDVFESVYGRLTSVTLTDRIPMYIKGDVVDICGDSDRGILCLLTNDGNQNTVYVWYHSKDDTGAATMSAWGKWTFPRYKKIAAMDIYQGNLYLFTYFVSAAAHRHHLERLDIANIPEAVSSNYKDGRGDIFSPTSYGYTVTLPVLYRRSQDGFAQTEGRTQVRYLKVDYLDTQYLKVTVDPALGETREYVIDSAFTRSGTLSVPVLCENTKVQITITSPNASCCVSGIEWEAYYHSRNQRI